MKKDGGEWTCLSMMVIIGATRVEAQKAAVRSEAMRQGRFLVLRLLETTELSMGTVTVGADIWTTGRAASHRCGPWMRM